MFALVKLYNAYAEEYVLTNKRKYILRDLNKYGIWKDM